MGNWLPWERWGNWNKECPCEYIHTHMNVHRDEGKGQKVKRMSNSARYRFVGINLLSKKDKTWRNVLKNSKKASLDLSFQKFTTSRWISHYNYLFLFFQQGSIDNWHNFSHLLWLRHWRMAGPVSIDDEVGEGRTYPIDQNLQCDFLVKKTLFVKKSKYLIF
jgi:uncharacterized protein YycO